MFPSMRYAARVTNSKADRLRDTPLFSSCDRKQLERLSSLIDTVNVEPGHELLVQGRQTQYAYVVESGVAEVRIDGEPVAEVLAGELVGEMSLLARGETSASVVSKTPMTLLTIPHQVFDQIVADTPGMGLSLAKDLARRLQATDRLLH